MKWRMYIGAARTPFSLISKKLHFHFCDDCFALFAITGTQLTFGFEGPLATAKMIVKWQIP